jgi:threonyl-tRNA synthetase
MPLRFDLNYKNDKSEENRPVMIHRAIFGSFERFMAILCEHYGGKWPFWLSPRQIIIIPVSSDNLDYADKIFKIFFEEGYYIELDNSSNQFKKKIRNAQLSQYNLIFILGKEEEKNNTINIRIREEGDNIIGEKSINEMIDYCRNLKVIN